MELQLIEDKIIAACQKAKSNGWKITRGVTIDRISKRCCPLATFGINEDRPIHLFDEARNQFGWILQTEYFIWGFDMYFAAADRHNDIIELGSKIAKMFCN